jgi:hypothetical protein
MAWAVKQSTGSPTCKLILLLLADRANDEGMCYPSIDTIARDCELGTATVKRNIKSLAEKGFLRIERRKSGNAYLHNMYHLIGVGSERSEGGVTVIQGVGSERSTNLYTEPIKEPIKRSRNKTITVNGEQQLLSDVSGKLSDYFIKRLEKAHNRKPLCKKSSNTRAFNKILKEGIEPKTIAQAIELVTDADYLQEEYHVVVQSGTALYDKWDKVMNALSRRQPQKERVKIEGDFALFIDREKVGDKYPRRLISQLDTTKYLMVS